MQNEDTNYSEEVKKYLFDPERPETFSTYKVLVKILKEGNNTVFLSNAFLLELFHDEIFDAKLKQELWNIPQNYDSLSAYEKSKVYIENFSIIAAEEKIEEKIKNLSLQFNEYLYTERKPNSNWYSVVHNKNIHTQKQYLRHN